MPDDNESPDRGTGEAGISRILFALDPSRQNRVALEQALALAERMRAELIALFVEDENLLHLAGLPFAREVHRISAGERKLDAAQMSRTLRRQSDSLRRLIEQSAEQRRIHVSLRVVQGHFIHTALMAAGETDVTFLNVRDRAADLLRFSAGPGSARPGSTVTVAAKPIWALFDGSAQSVRALQLALELSAPDSPDLMLVLPVSIKDQAGKLQQQAAQILQKYKAQAGFVSVAHAGPGELRRAIRQRGCSLLVLPQESALLSDAAFQSFSERIGCPLVLVR
jgi:nucleotide-binding universal stress UspA family protein